MRILVTGATGFLGTHLTLELAERKISFCALVRSNSNREHLDRLKVECREGDLTDASSLLPITDGCDAVIHLAAAADISNPKINSEVNIQGVSNLIDACRSSGTERVIFLSSTCATRKYRDAYGKSKLEGEHLFNESGLQVTIFRPTMIYGAGSKEFSTFIHTIRRLPVVPLIGPGTYRIRPSYVGDVIPAFINALTRDESIGKTYDIAGRDATSFNEFVQLIARLWGRSRVLCHLPAGPSLLLAKLLGKAMKKPPVTVDQVMAFLQDTEVDISTAERDFDFAPRSLSDGLPLVLEEMGFPPA